MTRFSAFALERALFLPLLFFAFACGDERAQTGVVEPLLLVASAPAPDADSVAVDATIQATFSRDVDESSLTAESFWLKDAQGAAVAGDITYDSETMTASLTPAEELAYSASYTYGLTNAVTSADGRELGNDQEVSFETEDPPPLRLIASTPADGAVNVPRDATIELVFSEAVDPATVTSETLTVTDTATGGGAVSGTSSVEGATVTFTPDELLDFSSVLEIVLGESIASTRATDRGGQLEGAPITITVNIVEPPPLFIVSSTPPDGATEASVVDPLVVVFSQPLDPLSVVDGDTLALVSGDATISLDETTPFEVDGEILTIWPADTAAFGDNALAYDTDYSLTLGAAVQSLDADPSRSSRGTLEEDEVIAFHTVAPPDLVLLLASPSNGATQVGLSKPIELTFSEPLDDATLQAAGAVTLIDDGGTAVDSAVSRDGSLVTVNHDALVRDTTHTLQLATSIASERGGLLTAPDAIAPACAADATKRCISFTTIAFEPLQIVDIFPNNLAVGVEPDLSPEGAIVIELSADVQPDSLCGRAWDPAAGACAGPTNLFLNPGRESNVGSAPAGLGLTYANNAGAYAAAQAAGPYVATLTPASDLAQNTQYTVTIKSAVAPVDSNVPPLAADFYSRFRTRISSRLLGVSPSADTCTVAEPALVSEDIHILFTEDVDEASVSLGNGGSVRVVYTDIFGLDHVLEGNVTFRGVDPESREDSLEYQSNLVTITPTPAGYDCLDGQHALPPNAEINVTVTTAVLRTDGSAMLDTPESVSFCTGDPMLFVAASSENGVVQASPVQAAESIPVNSALTVELDRPVDLTSAVVGADAATSSVLVELLEAGAAQADNNLAKCAAGFLESVTVEAAEDPTMMVVNPPADHYCYGAHYRVTLRGGVAAGSPPGLVGLDGVPLAHDVTIDFNTDDGNREQVADVHFPVNESGGACLSSLVQNANVEVLFEKPVLASSVTPQTVFIENIDAGEQFEFLPVVSADGGVLTLVPTPELPSDSHLLLTVSRNLLDIRGNPFPERNDRCIDSVAGPLEAGFVARFDVRGGQLFGKPCWGGVEPADGAATGVPGSVRPVVTLTNTDPPNGIMAQSLNCESIILRAQGTGENLCERVVYEPGDCQASAGGCAFEIWPRFATMLDQGTTYELFVGTGAANEIVDLTLVAVGAPGGCTAAPETLTFTVSDGHGAGPYAPTVTMAPADGTTDVPVTIEAIVMMFDMDLRPNSVTSDTFQVNGGAITGSINVKGSGTCGNAPCISNVIEFVPDANLPGPGSTITVDAIAGADCASSICDAAGHVIDATQTMSFTTNAISPTVASTDPTSGATISGDSVIEVSFDSVDPIDPSSIYFTTASQLGNIQLFDTLTGDQIHGCTGVVGLDGRTVRIETAEPYPAGATIKLLVGSGGACGAPPAPIRDVAGNAFSDDVVDEDECHDTVEFTIES